MRELGTGSDHRAYETDGGQVVRVATDPDRTRRAAKVRREAALLREVAACSPLPVPVPERVEPEEGRLVYRKLPGVPLLELPVEARLRLGAALHDALAAFLTAIHRLPVDRMAAIVDRDEAPLAEWRDEAAETAAGIAAELSAAGRAGVEAFLAGPLPPAPDEPAFCHGDLGAEHLLAEPPAWRLCGVIDWSDAAIADPARDLGPILRDLGPEALDRVLARYGPSEGRTEALRERAGFYARCKALEDLAWGLEHDRQQYVDNARAAITRLFS